MLHWPTRPAPLGNFEGLFAAARKVRTTPKTIPFGTSLAGDAHHHFYPTARTRRGGKVALGRHAEERLRRGGGQLTDSTDEFPTVDQVDVLVAGPALGFGGKVASGEEGSIGDFVRRHDAEQFAHRFYADFVSIPRFALDDHDRLGLPILEELHIDAAVGADAGGFRLVT